MSQPPAGPEVRPAPPFPSPAGIADALRFVRSGTAEVGAWAVYLPIVGLGFGALWLAADAGREVLKLESVVRLGAISARLIGFYPDGSTQPRRFACEG